uniref:Ubiquitin-like protease family profile domain-containing protein n=1 Tax=Glossina brevipalpis TaxID=37001 RepID=A0A1A9WGD6_9MUSC
MLDSAADQLTLGMDFLEKAQSSIIIAGLATQFWGSAPEQETNLDQEPSNSKSNLQVAASRGVKPNDPESSPAAVAPIRSKLSQGAIPKRSQSIPFSTVLNAMSARTTTSSLSIYLDDYLRLAPGRWLNDTLIEFHGMWVREALPREVNERIHIFSPFLYPELDREVPRWDILRRWTRKLNPLALGSLMISVCTTKHWVLAIACNPDLKDEKQRQILLLDSMKRPGIERIAGKIRKFIELEHGHRGTPELRITAKMLPLIAVEVLQQQNETDCGVSVIQNMLRYLLRKSTGWDPADLPNVWCTQEEATIPAGSWLAR